MLKYNFHFAIELHFDFELCIFLATSLYAATEIQGCYSAELILLWPLATAFYLVRPLQSHQICFLIHLGDPIALMHIFFDNF